MNSTINKIEEGILEVQELFRQIGDIHIDVDVFLNTLGDEDLILLCAAAKSANSSTDYIPFTDTEFPNAKLCNLLIPYVRVAQILCDGIVKYIFKSEINKGHDRGFVSEEIKKKIERYAVHEHLHNPFKLVLKERAVYNYFLIHYGVDDGEFLVGLFGHYVYQFRNAIGGHIGGTDRQTGEAEGGRFYSYYHNNYLGEKRPSIHNFAAEFILNESAYPNIKKEYISLMKKNLRYIYALYEEDL